MKSASINPRNSVFGSASWFVSHPDDATSLSRRYNKTTFASRILSFAPSFYANLRFWILKSRMAGTPLTGRNVTTMNCTVKLKPKTCNLLCNMAATRVVSRFTTYESRLSWSTQSSVPQKYLFFQANFCRLGDLNEIMSLEGKCCLGKVCRIVE